MTEVFTIIPAPPKALWVLGAIGLFVLAILLLFGYFAYSSRATTYEISDAGLAIRGTMYGRTLPWTSLDVERARTVDLAAAPELQPTLRTNGVGLPGYRAGWFRLRGGRGLLFVTDPTRVVAIPTHDGYTLLLSVPDPAAFERSLRAQAPPAR